MYIILAVSMSLGGWLPTLWGESIFGLVSVAGTVIGGIVGVYLYSKLVDVAISSNAPIRRHAR